MKTSVNSKVGAGAFAGALSIILIWLLKALAPDIEVTTEIASALTTVITFATSYFVPNMTSDPKTVPSNAESTPGHVGTPVVSPA